MISDVTTCSRLNPTKTILLLLSNLKSNLTSHAAQPLGSGALDQRSMTEPLIQTVLPCCYALTYTPSPMLNRTLLFEVSKRHPQRGK